MNSKDPTLVHSKSFETNHQKHEIMHVYLVTFLIGPLYLVGVWFGEDQRISTIKTHVLRRLDYVLYFSN
jgi:hypothetical protein